MVTAASLADDFVILGPAVAPGNSVLNAVHALYYLPQQYKLVLPTARHDQASYDAVLSLIHRDELDERVQFGGQTEETAQAVIVSGAASMPRQISGESPEALASAILDASRQVATSVA